MPRLTKKSWERLQRAGNQMANLCYNLSQHDGQKHAETMKQAQTEWDAAIESVRQEFIAREPIQRTARDREGTRTS